MPISIPSSPVGWNITWTTFIPGIGFVPSIQQLTFAIPAGTYVGAFLQLDGEWTTYHDGTGVGDEWPFDVVNPPMQTLSFNYASPTVPPVSFSRAYIFTSVGDLQNPGWNISTPTAFLDAINAAAGGNWTAYMSGSSTNDATVTRCTLVLTPAATGGGATQFVVMQSGGGNGCKTLGVQLLDAFQNAANAPAGGQAFTFSTECSDCSFSQTTLVIPEGSSNGSVDFCCEESGNCIVMICPGTGPLSALACWEIRVPITGAPSDPNTAVCNITRPMVRDAIRRKLGIEVPIDTGAGNSGDAPRGQLYPTNPALNQAIADTIRMINRKTNLYVNVNFQTMVPPVTSTFQGPLQVSLIGDSECATRLSINRVLRLVYTDSAGNITRLLPTSVYDRDKNLYDWDATYASVPRYFTIEAYSLLIWPAPLIGGKLTAYVETAIPNFQSDADWLDQIPVDYEAVIEDGACYLVCGYRPSEPQYKDQFAIYKNFFEDGIREIKRWLDRISAEFQPAVMVSTGRRRRVR